MSDYNQFFLMKPDDVKRYAVEVLHFFQPGDDILCREIGDGNINYVFKVWTEKDGRSVIVKQADKLLRSSGRPLDIHRNKIEAQILMLERKLAPAYIPEVYHYDETMAALSMEDISAYGNLRKELMAGRVYGHLSENLSEFLADVLLPTTDLVMDPQEKKEQVRFYINPQLCNITEELVLTEPYYEPYWRERTKNIITPGNEAFVKEFLYDNAPLQAEVGKLRVAFMNDAQALIHGDLHSGSIFANEQGVKIIDPEFAFYGPMGYDIGNVIGNLFFSWAYAVYVLPDGAETASALEKTVCELFDKTREKLSGKYDELVTFRYYRLPQFKEAWLDGVMADSMGFAGTEIIRRTVGDSKVMELTSVQDNARRVPMERALVKMGAGLILDRAAIRSGRELTERFRLILA